MTHTSLVTLVSLLVFLILLSGFFSGSETGMMSVNRYRLRHLAREKNSGAMRVSALLKRIDRLLGVILIGNTFANIFASAIATVIAIRLYGDIGVAYATAILTLIILIFAEITPKTLAALYPQKVSFLVSGPLKVLLTVLYPVVYVANTMANSILRMFGIKLQKEGSDHFSSEELRTVLSESTSRISAQHQDMLLRILDLEEMTVDDVMIPRSEIIGIDLEDDWNEILGLIVNCPHTRLPVYQDGIDNVQGIINSKDLLKLTGQSRLDRDSLAELVKEAYFIPKGASLSTQMMNFRQERHHVALVVDEYGDIQGLVTVEDIVEEIVGELSAETPSVSKLVTSQADGSYLADGSVNIRELNRLMSWELPVDGPKTLSGVIVEYLESIPEPGTCVKLNGYPVEVVDVYANMVKTALIFPRQKEETSGESSV